MVSRLQRQTNIIDNLIKMTLCDRERDTIRYAYYCGKQSQYTICTNKVKFGDKSRQKGGEKAHIRSESWDARVVVRAQPEDKAIPGFLVTIEARSW